MHDGHPSTLGRGAGLCRCGCTTGQPCGIIAASEAAAVAPRAAGGCLTRQLRSALSVWEEQQPGRGVRHVEPESWALAAVAGGNGSRVS